MKRTALLFAAAFALLATAARASIVWSGDYSTGDRTQWNEVEGLPERITVQQSTVRPGASFAARVELRNGDSANGGCRNELVRDAPITEGTEHYYGWSTKFDDSYPSNNTWQVFTQWHHSGSDGSPPVEMDVQGENISLTVHGDHILWYGPLQRGVWHDFVVHVLWHSDPAVGYLELWYDGKKVMEKNYQQTLYPGQYVYFKQGLYRDASIQQTAVVFHDGTKIGTTLADVAPQLVVAPPPDAGTPDAGTTGTGDAGTADAGATGTSDAGTTGADAGTGPLLNPGPVPSTVPARLDPPSGGCSSRGGAGCGAFASAALGALLLRRRKRASAACGPDMRRALRRPLDVHSPCSSTRAAAGSTIEFVDPETGATLPAELGGALHPRLQRDAGLLKQRRGAIDQALDAHGRSRGDG